VLRLLLGQRVDDVAERQQRPVDVSALFQPHAAILTPRKQIVNFW
jgi:hypothetical protein